MIDRWIDWFSIRQDVDTYKAFQKMGGLTFGTSYISPTKKNSQNERASFLFAFCATLDVEIATLDALDVGHHLSCSSLWWSHPQHWWQGQLVCVTWQLKQSDSGAVNKLGKGTGEMSVASIVLQSSLRQLDSWPRGNFHWFVRNIGPYGPQRSKFKLAFVFFFLHCQTF